MYLEHVYSGFEPMHAFHVVYGGYFEHRLLTPGRTSMRHQRLAVGDIRLETGEYDFPVVAQGNLPSDAFCIGFIASGAASTRFNTVLNVEDELQIYPPGAELLYHAARPSRWVSFTAPARVLQDTATARKGLRLALPTTSIAPVRLSFGGRVFLTQVVDHALAIAKTFEAGGGVPSEQADEISRALLASYIDALFSSNLTDGLKLTGAAARHHQVILACERLVKSGHEPNIALSEVARRSGYSLRALELIFQESVDMTPGLWFRKIRLNGALRDILSSEAGSTVSEIAQRWGFRHLARFSLYFRETFGELPSETLRRSMERSR